MLESIFEAIFELIFKTFFNSIGAAIRWTFFLGKYSYTNLFLQETIGQTHEIFLYPFKANQASF